MAHTAETLFERYHAAVYRYFRRMTGRHDVAQDLTQELFLRVHRALGAYQPAGHDGAWVFRIARNLAVDHRRKTTRRATGDWAEAAAATLEASQLVAFGLSEALALLNESDREAFLLRHVAGLTYAELAHVCQVSPEEIGIRVRNARLRLRHLLGAQLHGGSARNGPEDQRP